MLRTPALYLALGIVAAMAALTDIAAGFPERGYLRLLLLAFIAGGSISLSALTWEQPR